MKKIILFVIVTILLSVIAYNVGKLMASKVFEGDEDVAVSTQKSDESENAVEVTENEQTNENEEQTEQTETPVE